VLRAAIAARWAAMLQGGAIEEVRALGAQGWTRTAGNAGAWRAELLDALRGSLEAASALAVSTPAVHEAQATWFRHTAWAPAGARHVARMAATRNIRKVG
jgi:tRNA dimethylallyltransferase